MPENPPSPGAVFLSYAREDAEAARRIADALRAFGIEVWFDQSELRGGDSWDAKIKTQIRTCALFLPIVSSQTQTRSEGYFRREWKFGVERTHDMASGVAFVMPVVIDETPESDALVPEEFMRVQWTRLPRGVPTPQFIEHVKRILENPGKPAARGTSSPQQQRPAAAPAADAPLGRFRPPSALWALVLIVAVACAAAAWFMSRRPEAPLEAPKPPVEAKAAPPAAAPAGKSVAVLPFANFSPDKDNEFFADGLQDEVITALAKIHDLKVISRTSVLAYKNPDGRNLKKIGTELGVAAVLEGSVQRIGSKVHLNVQLIDAQTDDHLWANSYTEELTDVFSLESALAQQIAAALKASLTSDEKALIERRPTQNKEALDLYLRARVLQDGLGASNSTKEDALAVIALFDRASARDPMFALPHAQASIVHGIMYWFSGYDATPERAAKALAELETAKRLAPSDPETKLAQAEYDYTVVNDWGKALAGYQAAGVDLPNDSQVQYGIARSLRRLGRFSESLEGFKVAASLDPNNDTDAYTVVEMAFSLHRYQDAVDAGHFYGERFPQDEYLRRFLFEAQFQIDGDRAAFTKAVALLNPFGDKPPVVAYRQALLEGDLPAAERALSVEGITKVLNESGTISFPADLHRAYVAYLLGKADAAKAYSEAAIATMRQFNWTPRQRVWAKLAIAQAEAYEGRFDNAVRESKEALDDMAAKDAYECLSVRFEHGKILVIAGRRDEALAVLAEVVARPMFVAARSVRFDPVWSRLKDDPRFDSILNSVKAL